MNARRTLRARRTVRNFFLSPTTMQLATAGSAALISCSISTGGCVGDGVWSGKGG